MRNTLHFTNGDSAAGGMRAAGIGGEIIPWRDVLHEGPVPHGLALAELSRVRAKWLADVGLGDFDRIEKEFAERDDMLRRFGDFDEVVLWFEWDLYDQLQLIQILDFLGGSSSERRAETGTRMSMVSFGGYLGTLSSDQFGELYENRSRITDDMLSSGRHAWQAFRSGDPRDVERAARAAGTSLEFLDASLWRQLEELPSTRNGLSRSESQILEAVAPGPLSFHEIFGRVSSREERVFCGDAVMALQIERMSVTNSPLLAHTSGGPIRAPRTEDDSRAFRNAEIALTDAGREVLESGRDWIEMGGSERWIGGVHLDGSKIQWRWDPEARRVAARNGARV